MLSHPILSIATGILPVGGAAECCEVPILHAKRFLQRTHYHISRKFGEEFNLVACHAIISFPNFTLDNSYFADQGDHCPAIMTFSQHMKWYVVSELVMFQLNFTRCSSPAVQPKLW